jgi:hypothetical protein
MAIRTTNRMLAIVIALFLSSGIVAHAAQTSKRPLAPTTLPTDLQTAASRVGETATGAIDPSAAIRGAYQRDHVALERLRQQASPLNASSQGDFSQFISDQEAALAETERTALASSRPDASSAIAAMDTLVSAAQAELSRQLSASGAPRSQNSQ